MNLKSWCELQAGRQAALAAHLGVTPAAVSLAANGGMRVPPVWFRGIVEFTEGDVSFDDLVPAGKTAAKAA